MKELVKKIIKYINKYLLVYLLPSKKNDIISSETAEQIMQKHYPDMRSSPICKNMIHEKKYDLTVIVPVYNVEKYVSVCLNSLRNQKTRYAYHVIAINDGSTDNSENILKSFSDWRELLIINQTNRGLSAARNAGLQEVYGKYIMFVDSDDVLLENTIESLLSAAYSRDADIVQGGYLHISEDGEEYSDGVQYIDSSNVAPNGVLSGMAWGKVYKAELFSEVCFPEGYWYEDSIITGIITHLANNISTISDNVYFYRKNASGITHMSRGKAKSIDTFYVLRSTMNARKELNMQTDCAFYEHLLRVIPICAQRIKNEPKLVQVAMFVLIKDMLEKERGTFGSKIQTQYKMLEKVILNGEFNKYQLLCAYI